MFSGKKQIEYSHNNTMRQLFDIAENIGKMIPGIDVESCKNKIVFAAIDYRYQLANAIGADDKEYAQALFDVCCNARELLNSLNCLNSNGVQYVMARWDDKISSRRDLWDRTCEWLNELSKQCAPLAGFIKGIPSKPGVKGRTREAEAALLKAIGAVLPVAMPEIERGPIVRKIAIEIHAFTTGRKEPQKFRKLQKTV